ncbi:hypothetical protein M2262_003670 [Pseudomonas sp. BIGb0408]|uniref:Uncharacterized protein n=1 Tax=Phytopseudomonas flavescens TaxID=29435 RepID=A0A7Z0BMG5_9GAMM|nr:hypothetical protein [Pseudomonas sp. BIGb0408]NYH71810.1 hypothetical protein [Pseudomonas flavescens]
MPAIRAHGALPRSWVGDASLAWSGPVLPLCDRNGGQKQRCPPYGSRALRGRQQFVGAGHARDSRAWRAPTVVGRRCFTCVGGPSAPLCDRDGGQKQRCPPYGSRALRGRQQFVGAGRARDSRAWRAPTVVGWRRFTCVGASNLWERAMPAIRAHGALPPSWDGDASPARAPAIRGSGPCPRFARMARSHDCGWAMLHLRGRQQFVGAGRARDSRAWRAPTVVGWRRFTCVGASNLWERAVPAIRAHGALPRLWVGDASLAWSGPTAL